MFKSAASLLGIVLSFPVIAQTIPPLPGPIQPAAKDTNYYICDVASVNDNFTARSMGAGTTNLWTVAMKSGKFQSVTPSSVRVMSESEGTAASEIYAFYKKYAAAAFIQSPMYDKGTRLPQSGVVTKCVMDATRATKLDLRQVPLASYKRLVSDQDHMLNFLKLYKKPVTDEQLNKFTGEKYLPENGFEKQEQIQRVAASAKKALPAMPGPYVILESSLQLQPYSFEKKSFPLPNLQSSAERYIFSAKPTKASSLPPTYKLTVPASMMTYTPISIEEAKKIEQARTASAIMKLRTYVQINDTVIDNSGTPIVYATISAIEVSTAAGAQLFKISAQP